MAQNLGIQGLNLSLPASPEKRLFSRKGVVVAWADRLFEDYSAIKRESINETERHLLGYASFRDVFGCFLQQVQCIIDVEEKRFYVQRF